MDLQKSLIEIAKRITPDYVNMKDIAFRGNTDEIQFCFQDFKDEIEAIKKDFNSGRFGNAEARVDDLYENYLYQDTNHYVLDNFGYEWLLLSLIAEKAKHIRVLEYSSSFVTFSFTDKETNIVARHTFYNSPKDFFLIQAHEKEEEQPYFEIQMYRGKPYLVYCYRL